MQGIPGLVSAPVLEERRSPSVRAGPTPVGPSPASCRVSQGLGTKESHAERRPRPASCRGNEGLKTREARLSNRGTIGVKPKGAGMCMGFACSFQTQALPAPGREGPNRSMAGINSAPAELYCCCVGGLNKILRRSGHHCGGDSACNCAQSFPACACCGFNCSARRQGSMASVRCSSNVARQRARQKATSESHGRRI